MGNRALSSVALPRSSRSRWSRWLVVVAILLASSLIAACGAATARPNTSLFGASTPVPATSSAITPTVTPAVAAPTATTQPTVAPIPKSSLPTLAPPAGWHTALTLSDTTGAHGGDIAQGSFIASKSYIILYSCKGSGGALKVLYQDTIGGGYCANPPRIERTKTLRSTQPDHSAFVTVSPLGSVIWELLVATQD